MPVTGEFRNASIDAMTKGTKPSVLTEYVSVGENSGAAISTWSNVGEEELEHTSHGLVTGNLIVFTSVTGGGSVTGYDGIKVERPYYVEKITTNKIKISQTATIVAEKFAAVSNATVQQIVEIAITGGRQKVTFGSAARGKAEAGAAAGQIGVPACTVNWILYFSHLTETIAQGKLHGISKLGSPEVFAAPGKYEVEKSVLDQLGVA